MFTDLIFKITFSSYSNSFICDQANNTQVYTSINAKRPTTTHPSIDTKCGEWWPWWWANFRPSWKRCTYSVCRRSWTAFRRSHRRGATFLKNISCFLITTVTSIMHCTQLRYRTIEPIIRLRVRYSICISCFVYSTLIINASSSGRKWRRISVLTFMLVSFFLNAFCIEIILQWNDL